MRALALRTNDRRFITESIKIKEMSIHPISAKEEYVKNPKLKKSDIELLHQWVKAQSHLPPDITGLLINSCILRRRYLMNRIIFWWVELTGGMYVM